MQLIAVVACALVAVAVAAPPQPEQVNIVRSDINQQPDGSYDVVVETDNGYKHQVNGELVEVNNEEGKPVKVIIVRGSYSYKDPEGNDQTITYVGDQDGFHADGPSIPKIPSRR